MIRSRLDFIKITSLASAGFLLNHKMKDSSLDFQQELPSLMISDDGTPIHSLPEWEEQRKLIAKRWNGYLGVLDPNPDPPKLKIIAEEISDGLLRQLIEYENEPGMFVRSYLIKPQDIVKPLPGVVALHSTSDNKMLYIAGVEKGTIAALGYNLAKRGFVVICPQCFLWQDKGDRDYTQQVERFQIRHPRSRGMARMLFDARRAVDVLEHVEEADRERIGAMGHSLGGKEAFYLGAFDDRVKTIVSNEGGIGIDFSNWDDPWYLGKEIHNFGHAHHEVLALCAPKPFLLIGGESSDGEKSQSYIDAVLPVYELYGKTQNIKLFNHRQGHNVVPVAEDQTYDWLSSHL